MISFGPLWNTLKERNISREQLMNDYGIESQVREILEGQDDITVKTLHDICLALHCNISDIIKFI